MKALTESYSPSPNAVRNSLGFVGACLPEDCFGVLKIASTKPLRSDLADPLKAIRQDQNWSILGCVSLVRQSSVQAETSGLLI